MKMLYLSLRDFPRRVANRVQTIKMAEALSRYFDLTLSVSTLHVSTQELFLHYGVRSPFAVVALGEPRFRPATLSLLPRTLRLLRSLRPDFTFVREEYPAWVVSRFRSNVIYEMHDFDPSRLRLYKSIVKRSLHTVLITEALRRRCVEYGFPMEKITVLPDGVDLEIFKPDFDKIKARARLGLPREGHLIMYTGRLCEWKGIYTLIKSARYLPDNIRVMLVGGFEGERALVQEFIDVRDLGKKVSLAGYKEHHEIPYFMSAADVVVLPNTAGSEISKYYTSPLKLFEYMAAGRPIVASDLPSIREVLDDETAILVTPDDPQKLAMGIVSALNGGTRIQEMVQMSSVKVKQYSWDSRARTIMSKINSSA